jgi:protein gp37
MGDKTNIEWTDATWNPIRGCSVVSEGCRNCYAMQVAARFNQPGQAYEGLAYRNESGAHWTGEVALVEKHLEDPLRWKRPRRIFVNSMSDLFHESVPDEWIDRIFAVMADAVGSGSGHTFQILTKRPERMLAYCSDVETPRRIDSFMRGYGTTRAGSCTLPLSDVWLGVSIENQKTADERIPLLLKTTAAVRFVSAEPLLGPMPEYFHQWLARRELIGASIVSSQGIDWVIVGGESGTHARPMHPDWARSLRDQCVAAGVPFFFKQFGAWEVAEAGHPKDGWQTLGYSGRLLPAFPGAESEHEEPRCVARRVGKKQAGRLLDGSEWNQMPDATRIAGVSLRTTQ